MGRQQVEKLLVVVVVIVVLGNIRSSRSCSSLVEAIVQGVGVVGEGGYSVVVVDCLVEVVWILLWVLLPVQVKL